MIFVILKKINKQNKLTEKRELYYWLFEEIVTSPQRHIMHKD